MSIAARCDVAVRTYGVVVWAWSTVDADPTGGGSPDRRLMIWQARQPTCDDVLAAHLHVLWHHACKGGGRPI